MRKLLCVRGNNLNTDMRTGWSCGTELEQTNPKSSLAWKPSKISWHRAGSQIGIRVSSSNKSNSLIFWLPFPRMNLYQSQKILRCQHTTIHPDLILKFSCKPNETI